MQQSELDAIVEELVVRTGRSVSFDDIYGRLLAYNTSFQTLDAARIEAVLRKNVGPEWQLWEARHRLSSRSAPFVVPRSDEHGYLARLCIPVIYKGLRLGYVWVQARDRDDDLEALLEELQTETNLAEALGSRVDAVLRGRTNEREALRVDIGSALEGDTVAWAEVVGHFPKSAPLALHVFCPRQFSEVPPERMLLLLERAGEDASRTLPFTHTWVETATHVIVVSALMDDDAAGSFSKAFERALNMRMTSGDAGVSSAQARDVDWAVASVSSTTTRLDERYREAIVCLQARHVDPGVQGRQFDDIGIYQLLSVVSGGMDRGSARLQRLLRARNGEELVAMLERIYDSSASRQEIADALHLHRTTLYARMRRIAEIIDGDPLDAAVQLELHAAMKAKRWSERPRFSTGVPDDARRRSL